MSKTVELLTLLTKTISSSENFKDIPVYWDEIELNVNSAVLPCILLKPQEWSSSNDGCEEYERQLNVIILHNGLSKRDTLIQLWEYEEQLRSILQDVIYNSEYGWFDMQESGGSSMSIWTYNQVTQGSAARVRTFFSSALAIYYKLRY